MDAQTKISRAITKLVVRHPFFGSMCLSMKVMPEKSIPTMCTDGRSILWNPDFVDTMSEDECIGVIAHEVMHVTMKHMLRRGQRDPQKWNIACDYVINPILEDAGFTLPEGGLNSSDYKDLSAEAVFDRLPDDITESMAQAAGIGEVGDASDGGQPMSDAEVKQMEAEIDSKVMMAANGARAVGKLPVKIDQLVSRMKRSQVDWRDVLRRFVGGDQPDDYSMRRPQRKMYHMSGIVAPSVEKIGAGNLVIGIDTSASVSHEELSQFLGELNAISDDIKPSSITVITCDTKVRTIRKYDQGELIEDIKVGGRGGTMVGPVFEYIKDNLLDVDNMVYLTDLEVWDFPEHVDFPLLWVASWADAPAAPIGETTYLRAA